MGTIIRLMVDYDYNYDFDHNIDNEKRPEKTIPADV